MRQGFKYRESLQANMWLIPSLLSLLGAIAAAVSLYIDAEYMANHLSGTHLNLEASRSTLTTIATATVTITSVTFSITVLILSLAANQLGQRLIPNFMRQTTTQFALGFFLATFICTMLVLHGISVIQPGHIVPYVSVSLCLGLGVGCFIVLIYYINFITHVIQIDNVLEFLAEDMVHVIDTVFSDDTAVVIDSDKTLVTQGEPYEITSLGSGYIMMIDYDKVFKLACDNNHYVALHYAAGKYINKGLALMTVYHCEMTDSVRKQYHDSVVLNNYRTTVQDVEFIFEEYSEIALKALSPAVNNPYTTIHCVDRINEGLAYLASKQPISNVLYDQAKVPRVKRCAPSFEDIIATAYQRLRQSACHDMSVSIHIMISMKKIVSIELPEDFKKYLMSQAELLMQGIDEHKFTASDYEKVSQEYQHLVEVASREIKPIAPKKK